jgi:L-fucose isomerase-like protein
MNYGYMCRTQVEVKLNGSVVNFLDESLGNHLAMVPGDVVERLVEVCALLQIRPVMIN